ncbi:phosphate ABC transporter permease [Erythrobacter longus]|uniref:Phosphate transport system permease protein PstA n=1 Tax=Erythrobacter longus TaxID=1044 RepID=A0A074MHE0_ERYLO|nr:phosphate ABC transporter permease PstA [Erythrobacter longus]KEO91283.1 phosphate ABC transporter permease [Erythrobacter longus]
MSDTLAPTAGNAPVNAHDTERFAQRLKVRYAQERRFKMLGLAAISFSVIVLIVLLANMAFNGLGGFQRAELSVEIDFVQSGLTAPEQGATPAETMRSLDNQGLRSVVYGAAQASLGNEGAEELNSEAWREVAAMIHANPSMLTRKELLELPASANLSAGYSGEGSTQMQELASDLSAKGLLDKNFDFGFLERSDATDPQLAGIWGALKGSVLTMLVTFMLAFPIGIMAALYLEEYAPKNRWSDFLEVSINNLAAVPSIIFGLLGLFFLMTAFPTLRSTPIIAGVTLALMTMPVIVISGRNAIKAVPPSIRDGALAVGASPVQVVFHHVLPLALPGMLTGTIIGMARALGETAPLILIGLRAFVASPPDGFTSAATVLPVQIFLWSDEIDRGFVERTSAAIIVLLIVLLMMNGLAIYLRNKFEKSW